MATVLVDSYSESNRNGGWSLYIGGKVAAGQSFTGDGGVLNSCKFYLSKYGSPTGNAVAKIYAHTGTFGTSSIPTGAALATSDNFDVSTLSIYPTFSLKTFTFTGANKITLANGTNYVVSVEYGGGDSSNQVIIGVDDSSPSHAGNISSYISSWVAYTEDVIFYVYGEITHTATDSFITAESYTSKKGAVAAVIQSATFTEDYAYYSNRYGAAADSFILTESGAGGITQIKTFRIGLHRSLRL